MSKAWQEAGFTSQYAYSKARAQSREWAERHSRVPNSKWRPNLSGKDFRAYFNAYSSRATGSTARRAQGKSGGRPSNYVRHYLVNVIHAMTPDEFNELYSELE